MSRVSSPILFPCLSSHLSIPVCVFIPRVACAGARGIGGGGGGLARQWQGGACMLMGEGRIDDVAVCKLCKHAGHARTPKIIKNTIF